MNPLLILIPAFNEERLIGETLRQVKTGLAAFSGRGWETELIVCDNNSTDRTVEVRDGLASAGTQRVVSLGRAGTMPPGLAHDGFIPLHRFMRWVNEEGDQA